VTGLAFTAEGSGPTVVLLHPAGLSGAFWGGLPARLAAKWRVLAPDLGGHGASPDAARPGHMADRRAEVEALLDREANGPAVLIGVSFGGMVAQHVALHAPAKVRALVLAATAGAIPGNARPAILDRGRVAEAGGMEAVAGDTLDRWFNPDYLGSPKVAAVQARLLSDKPSNFAATWEAISDHDLLGDLPRLKIPVLTIAGETDRASLLPAMHALTDAIPHSRLEVIMGAPHMLQIEREAEFGRLVSGFLDGLEA
jgi:3-oxoadipate enol-lactonase